MKFKARVLWKYFGNSTPASNKRKHTSQEKDLSININRNPTLIVKKNELFKYITLIM
jgi:hypothetical protein